MRASWQLERRLYAAERRARKAEDRLAALDPIFRAARRWWRTKRPVDWTEAQHREGATVNTATPAEGQLAVAVVRGLDTLKRLAD